MPKSSLLGQVLVQYHKNLSPAYASNYTSVIEAKSLKVGPGLQFLLRER